MKHSLRPKGDVFIKFLSSEFRNPTGGRRGSRNSEKPEDIEDTKKHGPFNQ